MFKINKYDKVVLTPEDMLLLSQVKDLKMLHENEEFRLYHDFIGLCEEIANQKKQNFFRRGGLYDIHKKTPEWAKPYEGFLCYLARVVKLECDNIKPHEVTVVSVSAEEHWSKGRKEYIRYGNHSLQLPSGTIITDAVYVVTFLGDPTLMSPTKHILRVESPGGVEKVEYATEHMDTIALAMKQQGAS